MTTNDTTLAGPALSAAVAREVMGWHSEIHCGSGGNYQVWAKHGETHVRYAWCPDVDLKESREVIAEIQRRGLMNRLHGKLQDAWISARAVETFTEYLLTCPPADICRAALAVVREHNAKGVAE